VLNTDQNPADSLVGRVQVLSEQLDGLSDVHARELAQELLSAVMVLYGDGLQRIMSAIEDAGPVGVEICDALVADSAVGSLLLIHDLYPVAIETRVATALASVRPYMESHGGNVELISLEDGVAHLKLEGSCSGCSASQATLELAIKQALDEHCPDLAGLEVSGVTEPALATNTAYDACELPMAETALPMAPTGMALPVIQVGM